MNRLLFGSAVILVLVPFPASAELPGGAPPLRPPARLPGGAAPLQPASVLPGGPPNFAPQLPGTTPGSAVQLPGGAAPLLPAAQLPGGAPDFALQFPGTAPGAALQLPGAAPPAPVLLPVAQPPGAALPAPSVLPVVQLPGVGPGLAPQLSGVGPGLAAPRAPVFGAFPVTAGRFGMVRPGGFFRRPGFGTFLAYPYGSPFYGGFGGGFISGGYSPTFVVPFGGGYYDPYAYDLVAPPVLPPAPPTHIVELSGESPATLTLEFPAPATVWLNGKEVPGKPDTARTVTTPVLRPGHEYTFHVRARWKADGKTYEYNRDVTLAAGSRSKLLVVSGTALTGGQ
jgi:uncharacterized protein (TIGR03000 family)